jgi:hypothetical protein
MRVVEVGAFSIEAFAPVFFFIGAFRNADVRLLGDLALFQWIHGPSVFRIAPWWRRTRMEPHRGEGWNGICKGNRAIAGVLPYVTRESPVEGKAVSR